VGIGFKKATKLEAKIRIALYGPAGSGKTFTSLTLASVLGRKICVIDTEHGRASKYADRFDFEVCELSRFAPADYIAAINAAADCGCEVLVIDSLSNSWNGIGGCLEMVDRATQSAKGSSFNAWGKVTPEHQKLIEAITTAPYHIIATMRAKTEYAVEVQNGRAVPRRVGLAPIQRDGVEYEFDILGDLDYTHTLTISKSLVPELQDQSILQPGREVAQKILSWLGKGVTRQVPQPPAVAVSPIAEYLDDDQTGSEWNLSEQIDEQERTRLINLIEETVYKKGWNRSVFSARLHVKYGTPNLTELKIHQLQEVVDKLDANAPSPPPPPVAPVQADPASRKQIEQNTLAIKSRLGLTQNQFEEILRAEFSTLSLDTLSNPELVELGELLVKSQEKPKPDLTQVLRKHFRDSESLKNWLVDSYGVASIELLSDDLKSDLLTGITSGKIKTELNHLTEQLVDLLVKSKINWRTSVSVDPDTELADLSAADIWTIIQDCNKAIAEQKAIEKEKRAARKAVKSEG
jgi:hypothetical protein